MKRLAALLLILAVAVVGKDGDKPKNEASIEMQLKSKAPRSRERAAERLGEQGDRAAVKLLLPLLKDKDWGVRLAATRALAPIRSTPGREALRKQLRTGATSVIRGRTQE